LAREEKLCAFRLVAAWVEGVVGTRRSMALAEQLNVILVNVRLDGMDNAEVADIALGGRSIKSKSVNIIK
jgi:hypothetical protein